MAAGDMDINKVWDMLEKLVKQAATLMPGSTGKEKKAWCIEKATALVEMGDNFLPIIGAWADLPCVDEFESYLIGLAVERAWTKLQLPE